ncbi:hypothetical protein JCM10207_004408 [Rhodosporidiobolus poonsookiae]
MLEDAVPSTSSDLRHTTFENINLLRQTVDLLRARIDGMEDLLAKGFEGGAWEGAETGKDSAAPGQVATASEQPSLLTRPRPPPADSLSSSNRNPPHPNGAPASTLATGIGTTVGQVSEEDSASARQSREQAEEELEASVALEYMALGRNRRIGGMASSIQPTFSGTSPSQGMPAHPSDTTSPPFNGLASDAGHDLDTGSEPRHPLLLFPTMTTLLAALPQSLVLARQLLRHSLLQLGWHHSFIHGPSFLRTFDEFLVASTVGAAVDWRAGFASLCRGMEGGRPPALGWLGVLFALLLVGITNLRDNDGMVVEGVELANVDKPKLAHQWYTCALACLHHANFLQVHTLEALQALALLCGSAQGSSGPNTAPTLLGTAITICQDMGLHRLPSDEAFQSAVLDQLPADRVDLRAQKLIERETKKRVWYTFVSIDWFNIAYSRKTTVHPTQLLTPLPLNIRDEDLQRGEMINRPPSNYSSVSLLLLWVQIGRCLQLSFEHLDTHTESMPSYDFLLSIDQRMEAIIVNRPEWLKEGGPVESMPEGCADWIRVAFDIPTQHKLLTLHRPFLAQAFRDKRYESSRLRALSASRTILRDAARHHSSPSALLPLWIVPFSMSSAATVVLLDLFQRAELASRDGAVKRELDAARVEVRGALVALESLAGLSEVAQRSVTLIGNLLQEEQKMKETQSGGGTVEAGSKRAAPTEWEGVDERDARRLRAGEAPQPSASAVLEGASGSSATIGIGLASSIPPALSSAFSAPAPSFTSNPPPLFFDPLTDGAFDFDAAIDYFASGAGGEWSEAAGRAGYEGGFGAGGAASGGLDWLSGV